MASYRKPKDLASLISKPTKGLIKDERPIPNLNEEFNQYSEYALELVKAKSIGNVLIVEDDVLYAMFIEYVVRDFSKKLKCFKAGSEAEALRVLKSSRFDLVISDYFLEGTDTGLSLCRKIKYMYPDLKCLMISSMAFEKYQALVFGSGVEPEFMKKPISSDLIKKYLENFYD